MSAQDFTCSEGGVLLPPLNIDETHEVLAVVYALSLLWVFMGVSTLTERLMEAIAVITSKGRWVDDEPDEDGQPTQVEVLTWNPTVANLTLMAIGSSAPEILLSSVEMTAGGGFSGELGPITIVGSAGFNLLFISAVCVATIPDGETRAVKNYSVFALTAVASILAYVWLLAILVVWTPDVVTIVEAILTLLFLPVLVYLAYAADRGDIQKRIAELDVVIEKFEEELEEVVAVVEKDFEKVEDALKMTADATGLSDAAATIAENTGLSKLADDSGLTRLLEKKEKSEAEDDEEDEGGVAELLAAWELDQVVGARRRFMVELAVGSSFVMFKPWQVAAIVQGNIRTMTVKQAAQAVAWVGQQKSRADYRMQASRVMMGETTQADTAMAIKSGRKDLLGQAVQGVEDRTVGFAASNHVCLESDGKVVVTVVRHGDISSLLSVDYSTRNGTATGGTDKDGADFKHVSGTLEFEPYIGALNIEVPVYADYAVEDDETFEIVLARPVDTAPGGGRARQVSRSAGLTGANGKKAPPTRLMQPSVEVTIMDDDSGGTLGFLKTDDENGAVFKAVESAHYALLTVRRRGDPSANMSCKFRTFRGSATPGLAGAPGSEYEITYEWAAGGLDGEILFGPGEMLKDIMVDVFDSESFRKSEVFYVQLVDPQNCDLRNLTVARCTIGEDRAVQTFANDVVRELAEQSKTMALPNRYKVQHRVQVREEFEADSTVITELEIKHEIDALESRSMPDGRTRVRFAEYRGDKGKYTGVLAGWVSVTSADGEALLAPIASKKKSLMAEQQEHLNHALGELDQAEKKTLGKCLVTYLLFPWKMLTHLTPDPHMKGGWPCFVAVLVLIAMTTVVICDLAGLFGCATGVANSSIALVLIAIGTSLPDLYASRSAAVGDKHADAAIGNVTGSNAVNVFLGLGLPWSVASIYWAVVGATPEWIERVDADFPRMREAYPDGAFVVPAADLCFAAATFLFCAFIFMGVMLSRRRRFGYELGGDERQEVGAFLFFMWLFFVALCVTQFHGGFDHVDAAKAALLSETESFFGVGGDADGSAGDGSGGNFEEMVVQSGSNSWEGRVEVEVEVGDPVHQLLLSVVWVFIGLAGVGAALVCTLKAQREEREQVIKDQVAETRSMMYLDHGNGDDPEVWRLNYGLAVQGRECWVRDYDGSTRGDVVTDALHAEMGANLWKDQVQTFKRYGDEMTIAPVDEDKE